MKHVALILVLALCFSVLIGCGNDPSPSYTPAPQPPVTEMPTDPQIIPDFPQVPQTEPSATEATVPQTEVPTEEATVPQTEPEIPQTQPPQQDPSYTHAELIERIRAWYRAIVSDAGLESVTFGDAATVYLQNGQVVSIAEYRQLNDAADPAFATVHFYYQHGIPFFVFIEYDNWQYDEVRLYFADSQLIRWIIDKNSPQDNVPNTEWEDYYNQAYTALENAREALG